jgi:spermidine synthase
MTRRRTLKTGRSKRKGPQALVRGDILKAYLVVFIASFSMLVVEVVVGRILAPYVGVSLYTWTSIIGVVLAGISVGAYLGGVVADRYPRISTLGWLLFLSGLGVLSIPLLTHLIGRTVFHTGLMVRILWVTAIIFFIPSCILGMISPVVIKVLLQRLQETGQVVGRVYAFSTFGSILGTFSTGFLLISWLGTRNLLFGIGVLLLLAAPLFGNFLIRKRRLLFFFLLIPLLWGLYGYAFKPPLDESTFLFKESNYYTIRLKKDPANPKEKLITLYLDNLTHSCSDVDNPFRLEYRYIQSYEEILRWQAGKRGSFRTLFIGGGGYTFPRFVEAKYPGAEIDVVEIDPEVSRVSQAYLGVPKTTKIKTFNEDGRWFVMNRQGEEIYDFIFEDAFNDLSIPYHLTTKEFALQMKRILKKDGLLVTNVIDRFEKGSFIPSYIRTLEEVFGKGNVHLITLGPFKDYLGVINRIVVASQHALNMEDLIRSLTSGGATDRISFAMPQEQLQKHLDQFSPVILTDDYVPVDNMTAPNFDALYGYGR